MIKTNFRQPSSDRGIAEGPHPVRLLLLPDEEPHDPLRHVPRHHGAARALHLQAGIFGSAPRRPRLLLRHDGRLLREEGEHVRSHRQVRLLLAQGSCCRKFKFIMTWSN